MSAGLDTALDCKESIELDYRGCQRAKKQIGEEMRAREAVESSGGDGGDLARAENGGTASESSGARGDLRESFLVVLGR